MAITEKQKEQRVNHLGSSDMAAVLGFDPFKNAYDVWAEKTGKLEKDVKETKVMRRGQYLEVALLLFAQDILGKLIRNQYRSAKSLGLPLGSNQDAIVVKTGNPVEAKSRGLWGEHWGESNTDEVPDRVIIQCHVEMICSESEFCHVPVFLADREFQMFGVPLDGEVRDIICEAASVFWDKNIIADIPPEAKPSMSLIKRIRREPETVVEIPDDIVRRWLETKEHKKILEKEYKSATEEMLGKLGQAEAGRCSLGRITYLKQHRSGYVVEPTDFRIPRFKENRNGEK